MPKTIIRRLRFNVPSFLLGLASILDIGATLAPRQSEIYNIQPFEDVDMKALALDAEAVGEDFQTAFNKIERPRKTLDAA